MEVGCCPSSGEHYRVGQALANSIATRDYFLAGPTVEDLLEQLAAAKSKIAASVPGDQDDRNYGNLWVQSMDLQVRIETLEED